MSRPLQYTRLLSAYTRPSLSLHLNRTLLSPFLLPCRTATTDATRSQPPTHPPISARPTSRNFDAEKQRPDQLLPDDPAYFTGNPHYYKYLRQINAAIRENESQLRQLEDNGDAQTSADWMNLQTMQVQLEMKLDPTTYRNLTEKLNFLVPLASKNPKIEELLRPFVLPGQSLIKAAPETLTLDELGRSYTYGSRKRAIAQVWMVEGDGQIYVNGIPMIDVFPEIVERESIVRPFEATGTLGKYNVWALVQASGPMSQASAVAVAVARGIAVHNPHLKEHLQQLGMTTIDTRQKERIKTNKIGARKSRTWRKR
ncbi:37S ribosomal protein S9, mitochondrial [Rhizophlyctis rosea]|uniref:37S ribosomal protein S9, mitochondrial n=1 Tax=Rhizophlyctis rosea TaxID=64517 RepID=A0AAD5SRB9_9FUNG|nr:37S ribosomal protein S9, mitochondrial [Rhizophlyctis rosea]